MGIILYHVVCCLLGNSPASEFYRPTFLNTLSFPSSKEYTRKYTYPPVKMEQKECSEMSAYKIHTSENYPEESIQHSEHGKSLKLIILYHVFIFNVICSI
jgi:hypothetical protein